MAKQTNKQTNKQTMAKQTTNQPNKHTIRKQTNEPTNQKNLRLLGAAPTVVRERPRVFLAIFGISNNKRKNKAAKHILATKKSKSKKKKSKERGKGAHKQMGGGTNAPPPRSPLPQSRAP